MEKKTYNVYEVADIMSVSKGLIYESIRSGKLKAIRIGQRRVVISRSELERLLKNNI